MKKDKQKEKDFEDELPEVKVLNRLTSPFASKSKRTYQGSKKGWKDKKSL